MMFRRIFAVFVLLVFESGFLFLPKELIAAPIEQASDADQQISDFSLAGYGQQGKKTWDLSGTTADIFEDVIDLKNLTGNMYGEDEDMRLSADKGSFNKTSGKIHIEQNVVMTTTGGSKLTTDFLDWDRANQVISTDAPVTIEKGELYANAVGAWGRPDLNTMILKKDVMLIIEPKPKDAKAQEDPDEQERIVITCDGQLQVDYAKNTATFNKNVVVNRKGTQIYCDAMDINFASGGNNQEPKKEGAGGASSLFMGASINRIVARGNVKTVRGENITYSQEAVYSGQEKKLTLIGRPMLVLDTAGDFSGFNLSEK